MSGEEDFELLDEWGFSSLGWFFIVCRSKEIPGAISRSTQTSPKDERTTRTTAIMHLVSSSLLVGW